MKFNKIMFIALLAVLIFTVSAASASDNATDALTQDLIGEAVSAEIPADDSPEEIQTASVNFEEKLENTSGDFQIAENINVTFEGQMWIENLSNITASFPQSTQGEFCLKINDEVIYNESIDSTEISVPVKLPRDKFPYVIANIWPPMDCRNYAVTAFYNGIELNISHELKVMLRSPDYDYWWGISDEVLQYGTNYWATVIFPRSANGDAEIYVDDRLINRTRVVGPYVYYSPSEITGLGLGNHTFRVVYENDTYYNAKNMTFTFQVVNVKIDIPKNISIGHDDCIAVNVLENTSGTVKIYIDGILVKTGKTNRGDYIISLADYLMRNSSEVTVAFQGKDFSRTKTVRINITYDIEFYSYSEFIYGQDNTIEICLPDNYNNSLLEVYVDGIRWNFTRPAYYGNNIAEVNISSLGQGNHTLFATYPGDDRFTAKNATFNFTITYQVMYPFEIVFRDNNLFYLVLPEDAKGNLTVCINGEIYATVKMKKGYAQINVNDLDPGYVDLNASYIGDDYFVESTVISLYSEPKITVPYKVTVGQDSFITVEVPKSTEGYVLFTVDGDRQRNITIKNGTARFSLKNLGAGEHDMEVNYFTANYSSSKWISVSVLKPKIRVLSASLFTNGVAAKVKILDHAGRAVKKAWVTLHISGKSVRAKTLSNGIALIKASMKLNAKKYSVYVSCNGAKVSKKMNAKHVVQLKLTKVRASAGKLVLTAVLRDTKAIKSKIVTFKFNGRKYSAKTNSKGIAKVTVSKAVLSKLKVAKKVTYQATYLGDTVKKTVIVSK